MRLGGVPEGSRGRQLSADPLDGGEMTELVRNPRVGVVLVVAVIAVAASCKTPDGPRYPIPAQDLSAQVPEALTRSSSSICRTGRCMLTVAQFESSSTVINCPAFGSTTTSRLSSSPGSIIFFSSTTT